LYAAEAKWVVELPARLSALVLFRFLPLEIALEDGRLGVESGGLPPTHALL
jgi:hypothetical protein